MISVFPLFKVCKLKDLVYADHDQKLDYLNHWDLDNEEYFCQIYEVED